MRDLSGKKSGKLKIVERAFKKRSNYYWKCICDCGNEVFVLDVHLNAKHTKSCGCLKKRKKLPKYQSCKNRLLRSYKRHAKNRKLYFLLTDEQFFSLLVENCFYCNNVPQGILIENGEKFYYNGIDRVKNEIGYDLNNCRTCCKFCNMMKKTMTDVMFIEHCVKIAKFKGKL